MHLQKLLGDQGIQADFGKEFERLRMRNSSYTSSSSDDSNSEYIEDNPHNSESLKYSQFDDDTKTVLTLTENIAENFSESSNNSSSSQDATKITYLTNELLKFLSSKKGGLSNQLIEEAELQEGINRSLADQEKITKAMSNLNKEAASYGFICHEAGGGGDCFFHAVLDQLKRKNIVTYRDVSELRAVAVNHLLMHFEHYKPFLHQDDDIDREVNENVFVEKIMRGGEWADNIIILALSRALNLTLVIIRSDRAAPTIIRQPNSIPIIYLGYQVGVHYQSLVVDETSHNSDKKNINNFIENTAVDTFNIVASVTAANISTSTNSTNATTTVQNVIKPSLVHPATPVSIATNSHTIWRHTFNSDIADVNTLDFDQIKNDSLDSQIEQHTYSETSSDSESSLSS